MQIEAEIELVEDLYKHVKSLRINSKNDPYRSKAAADREIALQAELKQLKAQVAQALPGLEPAHAA